MFDEKWVVEHLPPSWAKRQYERTRRVAAVLVAFLLGVGALSVYALAQRSIAEELRSIAEAQRNIAEEQRNIAEARAGQLKKALKDVEDQRQQAERLAASESKAREEADQQRALAEGNAREAREAARRAEEATKRAEAALASQRSARLAAEAATAAAVELQQKAEEQAVTEQKYREAAMHYFKGDYSKAVSKFNEVVEKYRAMSPPDRQGIAFSLNIIGAAYQALNNREKALDSYQKALEEYTAINDASGQAYTLLNFGSIYKDTDTEKASEYFRHAAKLYGDKDKAGAADTLTALGKILYDPERYYSPKEKERIGKALSYYTEAAKLYREANDNSGETRSLVAIAQLYAKDDDSKDKSKALAAYTSLLELYKTNGNRSGAADALMSIAQIYSSNDNKENQIRSLREALTVYREIKDRSGETSTLRSLAYAYKNSGKKEAALEIFRQLQQSFHDQKKYGEEISTLIVIGNTYLEENDTAKAIEHYQSALTMLADNKEPTADDKAQTAITLRTLAQTYNRAGNKKLAIEYYDKAREAYSQMPSKADTRDSYIPNDDPAIEAARMLAVTAEIYYSTGDKQNALDRFKQLHELYLRERVIRDKINSLYIIGSIIDISQEIGEPQKSDEFFRASLTRDMRLSMRVDLLTDLISIYDNQRRNQYIAQLRSIFRSRVAPKSPELMLWASHAYTVAGDREGALDLLDRVYSMLQGFDTKPDAENNRYVLFQVARRYTDLGQRKKASEIYQQLELNLGPISFRNMTDEEPSELGDEKP